MNCFISKTNNAVFASEDYNIKQKKYVSKLPPVTEKINGYNTEREVMVYGLLGSST